jgi:hypothetical protein
MTKIYPLSYGKHVLRLLYIHRGYRDYYLFNIVSGVLLDILFISTKAGDKHREFKQ